VLEPIVRVAISTPAASIGDVTSDLATRRARISGQDTLPGGRAEIAALVPLAELQDYLSRLKALTGGEGTYTMDLSHYDPVPPRRQQELVAATSRTRRRSSRARGRRVYAFVHIEKTAGRTVRAVLLRSFGAGHCEIRTPYARRAAETDEHRVHVRAADLRKVRRIYRGLRGIAGHNVKPYSDLDAEVPASATSPSCAIR